MVGMENQIKNEMNNLSKTIKKVHSVEGALTNKQIIDLVVAIDPIIAELGRLLGTLDPEYDSQIIEEARVAYEENSYLLDVLMNKIKEFH